MLHVNPRSVAMLCRPKAPEAQLAMPPSSASADDRHTVEWVFEVVLMQCNPRRVQAPDVLRLVTLHPAKSVSV